MTDRLRIVHCSDIHLDGDIGYRSDAVPIRDLFETALAAMRAHEPDLMLLAGDLFDSNRAKPDTIAWAMEVLATQELPIFMIPGNHDCLNEVSLYHRHDFSELPNLHFLDAAEGDIAHHDPLGVAVWGKGMPDHTPDYRPLAGCPPRPEGCRWYLGMGHGLYVADGEVTDRSSPIARADIEASPFDYLALGHHHAAMAVTTETTLAAYSGSPTDDIGAGATYALVELAEGEEPRLDILTIES